MLPSLSSTFALCLVYSLCIAPAVSGQLHPHFHHFFPGWSQLITDTIQANCSEQLLAYYEATGSAIRGSGNAVVDCILISSFTESRKLEMAAAGLVLGLTPTILQTLSASSEEIGLLSLRRPGLAFLLAAGSPVLNTLQSSLYSDSIVASHRPRISRSSLFRGGRLFRFLVSLVEYILAVAAVGNVALAAYQLSTWSVIVYISYNYAMAPFWTSSALIIYVLGAGASRLRFTISSKDSQQPTGSAPGRAWRQLLFRSLRQEFTPLLHGEPLSLGFQPDWYYPYFLVVSWIVQFLTVSHILLGTLVLSGQSLINLVDSTILVIRYGLSGVVCKAIVKYELLAVRLDSQPRQGESGNRNEELRRTD